MNKPGRNDPCPCGSGKKYKKCCLENAPSSVADLNWRKMRRTEGELVHLLLKHAESHYGRESIVEAWDEFTLWEDVPLDPESEPELDTAFPPWFVFNWIPDNAEVDENEHYPEMQVAMHYLRQKGSHIDSYQRRFIEEICSQPYSFFMVTDVIPGQQLTLRDLILRREMTVLERQASATLNNGMILFSRVITLDDSSIMVGCAPAAIPPGYINEIIDFREDLARRSPQVDPDLLHDYGIEIREIYYGLREAVWYPSPPELQNTDGDALQLTKLFYTLKCTPREALVALATLSMCDADELIHEGSFDKQGELLSIEFSWLKKGNKQHANWDNTVLGHIAIEGDVLSIDVNSQQRADAVKRKISRRLGKRAVFRNAVIQSTEKMLEEMQHNPACRKEPPGQDSEDLMALPEVQAELQKMADQHWREWLDTPVPALKGHTPREAAKTALGRERLEALLFELARNNERTQPISADVEALRQSLGLD